MQAPRDWGMIGSGGRSQQSNCPQLRSSKVDGVWYEPIIRCRDCAFDFC